MSSWYDPQERKIHIAPEASLYVRFHELAHKEQHEQGALCFRIWVRVCQIRFARYFASLWVEFDAHQRARRVMQTLGLWTEGANRQGRSNLVSYLLKRERQ